MVGDKWTYRIVNELDQSERQAVVRALRIEREARWKQRGNNATGVSKWTYWYSSTVKRFVRAEETNVTTEGKVLTRNHHELVSHSVK